jgi:hypothetical protein
MDWIKLLHRFDPITAVVFAADRSRIAAVTANRARANAIEAHSLSTDDSADGCRAISRRMRV